MKKILLITSQFPYGTGEQFLETELKYYNKEDIKLTIIPSVKSEKCRDISSNITVDDYLSDNMYKENKLSYLLNSLFKKAFYKEIISNNLFNPIKFKSFISSIYHYQMYYEILDKYLQQLKDRDNLIIYTYWNTEITYALQSLKSKYNYKIVSRIHRGDLYKERQPFGYMPLKKQFTNNIDTLYTITKSANSYLEQTYGFPKDVLRLSRLGVEDNGIVTKQTDDNQFTIVSCSYVVKVKKIDKIIFALKELSKQRNNITFKWLHIGDGFLFKEMQELARKELSEISNIKYQLLGQMENRFIYEFYKNNKIDVFVNVSESEGVPVSIMEAMSCHIPVVAPNVGGISDMLIAGVNGKLLSSECLIGEVVYALENIDFFKEEKIRGNSFSIYKEKYDAKNNYSNFVESLIL